MAQPVASSRVFEALSRRLRFLREGASYTQAQLANEIGLSSELISRIERGKTLPSLETLTRLCRVLNCTPNDLLLDSPPPQERLERVLMQLRTSPQHVRDQVLYSVEATLAFELQRRT